MSKLPPLNFTEEIESFDAHHESVELNETKCPHKNIHIDGHWLKCRCGAQWQGNVSDLELLKESLLKR